MVLHCAYLIVLVPVCYGLFYGFLKVGLFEKVVSISFYKKNCTCLSIFNFFFFLGGGGGGWGAHIWETMYLGEYYAMFCFLENF